MSALVATGDRLFLSPSLAREAAQRKLKQSFRVWCLLRHFDGKHTGFVDQAETLALLQGLGWSRASAYRLLGRGQGTFWRKERYDYGDKWGLRLVGAMKLGDAWGIEYMAQYQTEIPLELCLPPKDRGKAKGVKDWNALLYLIQLPRQRPVRIKKYENRKLRLLKPYPVHPYSRIKQRADMGVPERCQRRYDRLRGHDGSLLVRRGKPNYMAIKHTHLHVLDERVDLLFREGARVTRRYRPEGFHYDLMETALMLVQGKSGLIAIPRRLGHSYESTIGTRGYGAAKAYNRCPGVVRHQSKAHGSFNTRETPRRFFDREQVLLKATMQHKPLLDTPAFLLAARDRRKPWAREWGTWAT